MPHARDPSFGSHKSLRAPTSRAVFCDGRRPANKSDREPTLQFFPSAMETRISSREQVLSWQSRPRRSGKELAYDQRFTCRGQRSVSMPFFFLCLIDCSADRTGPIVTTGVARSAGAGTSACRGPLWSS